MNMHFKTPRLNKKGNPICEICEVGYSRLLRHVSARHSLSPLEYKMKFGFSTRIGIVSKRLRSKHSRAARRNYNTVIMNNLIIGGQKTRFKDGNTATNRELVGKITKARHAANREAKKETKEQMMKRLINALSPKRVSKYTKLIEQLKRVNTD